MSDPHRSPGPLASTSAPALSVVGSGADSNAHDTEAAAQEAHASRGVGGASYAIADHLDHVERLLSTHPGWTRGTAHLNALDDIAPDIALIVRGKVLDPTIWPDAEDQFVAWLSHLLDSPVGQSMLAPVA